MAAIREGPWPTGLRVHEGEIVRHKGSEEPPPRCPSADPGACSGTEGVELLRATTSTGTQMGPQHSVNGGHTMGLMDKVKAQATVLADKAQTGMQQGQSKLQEMQADRKVDHLLHRHRGLCVPERARTCPARCRSQGC